MHLGIIQLSTAQLVLVGIAVVLAYVMIVGICQKVFYKQITKHCEYCSANSDCYRDHDMSSWISAFVWPGSLTLLLILGIGWVPFKMGTKIGEWVS